MSQLAVLHATNTHTFPDALRSESYKASHYIPASFPAANIAHPSGLGISNLPAIPSSFESLETSSVVSEVHIPGLPPLAQGHPAHIARSRLLQAAIDDKTNVPNAEKAFFVANLGQVYKQFIRWKRSLPDIEPFYGKGSSTMLRNRD